MMLEQIKHVNGAKANYISWLMSFIKHYSPIGKLKEEEQERIEDDRKPRQDRDA